MNKKRLKKNSPQVNLDHPIKKDDPNLSNNLKKKTATNSRIWHFQARFSTVALELTT